MVGDIRTLSPLLLPPSPNYSFGTFIKSQVPNPVPLECWQFEDQEVVKKKIQELRRCQSLISGGIFDTWSESQFFQTCGRSGKLWSTWRSFLGQHQAAGINLKVNLGLCIAYRWSETLCSPQEESLWSFPEGTPTLPPFLLKSNPTIQGWLTDSSRPFPSANLTLSDP